MIFSNPEFVRNFRSQLRPTKMAIAAVIAAMLSLVIVAAINHSPAPSAGPMGWGLTLLRTIFWLQALILAAGGGIACVNAIYKEKDQNTFDFQRVTRLSPLELTLGKLFGAPVFMYFLCLCCIPLTIFCAVRAKQDFTFVLAAYAVLLVGSIAFHALALLISLLTVRGSHTSAIIFVLVLLWGFSNIFNLTPNELRLASLSPFYSSELAAARSWSATPAPFAGGYYGQTTITDTFFGHAVSHLPVFLILDLLLLAWFLLALSRNIKRDPDQYELYSPLQSLGIVVFMNLVLLAFVNWTSGSLLEVQAALLTVNLAVLSCIGLAQLRNRDRTRRILRVQAGAAPSALDLAWPAPFLFLAALIATLMITGAATVARDPAAEWSPAFALFRSLFLVGWLLRDMQFLQWMILRRGKRPLVMGVLYLAVFYACVGIILSTFGTFGKPDQVPFTAFFVPTPIFYLDHAAWILRPAIWGAAFVAQYLMVAAIIFAQRNTILELAHPSEGAPVPAVAN